MVKSIEIYDPRIGSWTTGEPMNIQRGYAAAAILKKSLYIIGGVENGDNITDIVSSLLRSRIIIKNLSSVAQVSTITFSPCLFGDTGGMLRGGPGMAVNQP